MVVFSSIMESDSYNHHTVLGTIGYVLQFLEILFYISFEPSTIDEVHLNYNSVPNPTIYPNNLMTCTMVGLIFQVLKKEKLRVTSCKHYFKIDPVNTMQMGLYCSSDTTCSVWPRVSVTNLMDKQTLQ